VLRTLGVAALLVQATRQARLSVLPLWCEQIGLDAADTSLVVGISGAVDMLLFYPAGSVMDRMGRAWVGVPSMVVLGAAHLALPLTAGTVGVVAVAVAMGVGNGMGAGLVMTLGADVSPPLARATFLGAWRLVSDVGGFAGPLLVAGAAAVAPLGVASVAVAVVAFGGATALHAWTPPPPARQPAGSTSV
jgi:MFS family permease